MNAFLRRLRDVMGGAKLAIAEASMRDAATIMRLHGQSFRRGWREDEIERLLADKSVLTHRAATGRRMDGFIMSRIAATEAEILSVAVAPSRMGRGIGRQLLSLHLGRLMALGVRTVFLEVDEQNEVAVRLYRRAGFKEVGRRQAYYTQAEGKRADALVLRRDIS